MKLEKDFGQYGGQYVPETLMTVLKVLEKEFEDYCFTDEFKNVKVLAKGEINEKAEMISVER